MEETSGGVLVTFALTVQAHEGVNEGAEQVLPEDATGLGKRLGETRFAILSRIQENPEIAIVKLAQELGLSTTAVEKQIGLLKEQGYLKRVGPAKGGHWVVIAG